MMTTLTKVACVACAHFRRPDMPELPPPPPHPDAMKTYAEELKRRAQIALAEQNILDSGQPFTYRPKTLQWCEAWTREEGTLVVNPVSGLHDRVYVPCARGNHNGNCNKFEFRRR